jgi:hypothetical protein
MKNRIQKAIKLALSMVLIAVIWLTVLPRLSDIPSVRERIERNRNAGVNPTAVFYTDHPGMADFERSIQSRVEAPTGWFWKPSYGSTTESR